MNYFMETIGQPSFYNPQIRKMNIEFEIPDNISEDNRPGLLLLIAGFCGHYHSNIYKKMRRIFAAERNYITIQCNYFGTEFMQSEVLKETTDNFCDLGPIQAMDNLIALRCVKDFLVEKGIPYDSTNVVAYGHSHGGYLALLMNSFMPNVLSCIIDNSGWIFPAYIDSKRYLASIDKNSNKDLLIFDYLISKIIFDREIYNLTEMYKKTINNTRIISFQGVHDTLVSVNEKCTFISEIPNSSIELIGSSRIDEEIFKSSTHALNADFINMFNYAIERYNMKSPKPVLQFENYEFNTAVALYNIDNSDGIPILYCEPK